MFVFKIESTLIMIIIITFKLLSIISLILIFYCHHNFYHIFKITRQIAPLQRLETKVKLWCTIAYVMLWEEQEQTPSPLIFWLSTVLSSLPPLRFVPWLSTSSECVQTSVRTIYLEWYVQFFFRYAHVSILTTVLVSLFFSIYHSLSLSLIISI